MLKQRLITAAVLIPLVVLGILNLSSDVLNWFIALVVGLAAWEWLTLIGIADPIRRLLWVSGLFVLAQVFTESLPLGFVVFLAVLAWTVASVAIIQFRHTGLPRQLKTLFQSPVFGVATMIGLLALFWSTSISLHRNPLGPEQFLYVLVTVWLADTGGYFAGKKWGHSPLAKEVSPNKTWQGVYGALVLTSIWAVIAYMMGINGTLSFVAWLLLTVVTVAVSIVGDLFESLFKRSHQVKDSGNLLPGHGGVLDRIDSLIAAVPIFVTGLMLLGTI